MNQNHLDPCIVVEPVPDFLAGAGAGASKNTPASALGPSVAELPLFWAAPALDV